MYAALARDRTCPDWLAEAASRAWGINLTGRPVARTVLIRGESALSYGRASYVAYRPLTAVPVNQDDATTLSGVMLRTVTTDLSSPRARHLRQRANGWT